MKLKQPFYLFFTDILDVREPQGLRDTRNTYLMCAEDAKSGYRAQRDPATNNMSLRKNLSEIRINTIF